MKVLIKDNEIIVRIVQESDPDYELQTSSSFGEIVDNDYSASLGQLKVNNQPPINTTPETFVRSHGSTIRIDTKYEMIHRMGGDDLISACDDAEILSWWNGLANTDPIVFNSDCPILNETVFSAQQLYDFFGVTIPERLYQPAPSEE